MALMSDENPLRPRKIRNGTCSVRICPPNFGDGSTFEQVSPVHSDQFKKKNSKNGSNCSSFESNGQTGRSKYLPKKEAKVKFWDPRCKDDDSEKMAKSTDPQVETMKRNKIMEVAELFEKRHKELLLAHKHKTVDKKSLCIIAAKMVKAEMNWINNERVIGHIPGVKVGDRFFWRGVLHIIGLHCQYVAGIDFKEEGECTLATSVVDSSRYKLAFDRCNDNRESSYDVLYYIGEGGNPQVGDVEPEDQKLKGGNKALMNSIKARNEVRVIRKIQGLKDSESTWAYVYYGLYTVEDCKQERSIYGKLVFVFKLKRKAGQPELNFDTMSNPSEEGKTSQGKEKSPTQAMDSVNYEKVPHFDGINEMMSGKPSYCENWVNQNGLRYPLEIFRKGTRGWGVRSQDFITRGSLICEVVGILAQDEDGKLTNVDNDDDDYKENMDIDGDAGFTIDAAESWDIGSYIKYSYTPNLYAKRVLQGQGLPRVMLYALEHIYPNQELTLNNKIL